GGWPHVVDTGNRGGFNPAARIVAPDRRHARHRRGRHGLLQAIQQNHNRGRTRRDLTGAARASFGPGRAPGLFFLLKPMILLAVSTPLPTLRPATQPREDPMKSMPKRAAAKTAPEAKTADRSATKARKAAAPTK